MPPIDSAWSIYYNCGKRSVKIAIIKNPLVTMVAASPPHVTIATEKVKLSYTLYITLAPNPKSQLARKVLSVSCQHKDLVIFPMGTLVTFQLAIAFELLMQLV
jgi:hypothetical protein